MPTFQTGIITNYQEMNPSELTGGDTSTFQTVTFTTPFDANDTVIVIPMVQTFNGQQTPGLRIAEVTPTGFKYRINEIVTVNGALSNGIHDSEDIGWVAVVV